MKRCIGGAAALMLALPFFGGAAQAQIVVSANDNKAVLVNGVNTVPANPAPDTVAVIDFNLSPPKVIIELNVPNSVVGPPSSVAVSRDETVAIVTAASKIDPNDAHKTVPDNKVTVIDLKAQPPAVASTAAAGAGAAGLAINPAGNLVLVANRSEGTVSVFRLADKKLTPVGEKIPLGDAKSGPSAISFTPDGRTALVSRDGDHKISILSIDGDKVEYTKRDLHAGLRPYPLDISSRGDVAVVANIGIGSGDTDTVSLIDLAAKPPRVVDTISVGQTPEGLKISPDGSHVAVTSMNGSNKAPSSPFFGDKGAVVVFAIQGKKLVRVAQGDVGHWCQGAAWSKDGRQVAVGCMVERELRLLSFDGKELKNTGAVKVSGGAAAMGTAH